MFCINCGNKLPLEARFCPNCGIAVLESDGDPSNKSGENVLSVSTYRLTFRRSNQFFVVNPPMTIFIDRTNQLSVENGEESSINLPEGQHHIVIASSIRKKSFDMLLKEDTVVSIRWNRLNGTLQAEIC